VSSSNFELELHSALHRFHTNLGRVAYFCLLAANTRFAFNTYLGRAAFLKDFDRKSVSEYTIIFPDLEHYMNKYGTREGFWRWTRSLPRKISRLIYQQSLVFMVSNLEIFIEDIAFRIFTIRPKTLSSGRTITAESIIELGDYDSLIQELAANRAKDMISGDWNKIVDEFNKLYNIDFDKIVNNHKVSEIFEIRHIIVHNLAFVDQRFLIKVNNSHWSLKYALNQEISLNVSVIDNIQTYLYSVGDLIFDSVIYKFGNS